MYWPTGIMNVHACPAFSFFGFIWMSLVYQKKFRSIPLDYEQLIICYVSYKVAITIILYKLIAFELEFLSAYNNYNKIVV